MKSIYFITTLAITSLFMSGCGEDRSQGTYNLSETGSKRLWIYESEQGKIMVENNFVYIPGGFDVDGDGKKEGGFWLSQYEARSDGSSNLEVNENEVLSSFKLYNSNKKDYSDTLNSGVFNGLGLKGIKGKVKFDDSDNIATNITTVEASTMLQLSQLDNGYPFSLVSKKQYKHLLMLINQNIANSKNKDNRYVEISNSLFEEVDSNVPKSYKVKIYDILNENKEWTNNVTLLVPQDSEEIDFNNAESYGVSAVSFSKNVDENLTDKFILYNLNYADMNIAFRAASDYLY